MSSAPVMDGLGWKAMPRPNRKLTALAHTVADLARPLLPPDQGLFLGIEINGEGVLRLLWWRCDDFRLVAEIAAAPEGFCAPDSEEGALQDAGFELLDYLAGRWPMPPSGLGVITDGVGVAFAPDRPAPSAEGWLFRQAGNDNSLLAIVPLAPAGPCALLAGTPLLAFH